MSVQIEHRGYTIRHNDNMDEWSCSELEISAMKLSVVKDRIAAELLKQRRKAAFDVFLLEEQHNDRSCAVFTEAQAIDFKVVQERSYGGVRSGQRVDVPKIGIMVAKSSRLGSSTRRSKSWETPGDLVPMTPEAEAALGAAQEAFGVLRDARAAYATALKAIPRMTTADFAELQQVAETQE